MFIALPNKSSGVLCTVVIAGALSNTPQWRPGAGRVRGRHSGVSRLQSADASLCLTGRGTAQKERHTLLSLALTLRRVTDSHLEVLLTALQERLRALAISGEQRWHFRLVMYLLPWGCYRHRVTGIWPTARFRTKSQTAKGKRMISQRILCQK